MSSKKATSSGVGPSKPHVAPEGTFEPALDWSKLTINGEPVPEEVWGKLPYRLTDQGAAEEMARIIKGNGGRTQTAHVEITRDKDDKAIDRFRHVDHERSPLAIMQDRYTGAGMSSRWFGARKMEEAGLIRKGIEYSIVKYPPGHEKAGQAVMQGGMMLGEAPAGVVDDAREFFRSKADDAMQAAQDRVAEQVEQVVPKETMRRMARQSGAQDFLSGIQVEEADEALVEG
jgi:hypothetical protein